MNKTYREIFIGTVGITPQIITEALYYYYTQTPPREFSRIILLTTRTGKECIVKTLFRQKKLQQLVSVLGLPSDAIPLTPDDIVLFHDQKGNELDDIRTDSASFHELADIFQVINDQARDPRARLTVTIAGGRKTMSVAVGLAMQVFARNQDEMIHILVQPPFDQRQDWFFPDDPNDSAQSIDIIQIPFLRVHPFLPPKLVQSKAPLELLRLAQAQLELNRPVREVRVDGNSLVVDDQEIRIPPKEMSLWRWLARQKIENCTQPERTLCGTCRECWREHSVMVDMYNHDILKEYELILGADNTRVMDRKRMQKQRNTDITEILSQTRSKFNQKIRKSELLPILHKIALEISIEGKYNEKRYGIRLEKVALKSLK